MELKAKFFAALVIGAGFLGGTQALAENKSSYTSVSYDQRGYDNDYYDDRGRYDDRRYRKNDRRYRNSDYRRGDRYSPRSRVVKRRTFDTRYRARIKLVEEVYYTRSGREQLVCTVLARGPESDYVPQRRLRKVARRNCSRYARVQYRTNYHRSRY